MSVHLLVIICTGRAIKGLLNYGNVVNLVCHIKYINGRRIAVDTCHC